MGDNVTKYKKWNVSHARKKEKLYSADDIVKVVLDNRGLTTAKKVKEFLNPNHPNKITLRSVGISEKEVRKAIGAIKEAAKGKKKIVVFGDYDADGVCASAIVWETLHALKIDAVPYLPERFSEGYGLSDKAIYSIAKKYPDVGLIITVDNGIVANAPVKTAKKLGISVVVTDHHEKGKDSLLANAVVHTTKLCGASVAWIFAREIMRAYRSNNQGLLEEGLALVAIGTLADQMPLVSENRSFAYWGLVSINKTQRIGLLALVREAGLSLGDIGEYEIGFVIAPRINAAGRMAHAIDSLRLLCTKDAVRAMKLAGSLSGINRDRQAEVSQSLEIVQRNVGVDNNSIVIFSSEYHEGVIGLIAGRLADKHYRPTIVLSVGGDVSKASARSIPGFNIIEAIRFHKELIIEGGGHPMAAGFSIETKKIQEFADAFEKYSQKLLTPNLLERQVEADMELVVEEINGKLADKMIKMAPFGNNNPKPLFVLKNIQVSDVRKIGKDNKHLKFYVAINSKERIGAVAFGFGEFFDKISSSSTVNILFYIDENNWNGKTTTQLMVKDISLN
ncbi:single-stranded-DNA-specific exonuclease RecJ [Candidatus Microgenomates bacterium]|nr:MAG: single-stranded-DNA-specific exonuclease RecJ [Candidatus Microgenomates bacterium]